MLCEFITRWAGREAMDGHDQRLVEDKRQESTSGNSGVPSMKSGACLNVFWFHLLLPPLCHVGSTFRRRTHATRLHSSAITYCEEEKVLGKRCVKFGAIEVIRVIENLTLRSVEHSSGRRGVCIVKSMSTAP